MKPALVVVFAASLALAGCDSPTPLVDTCVPPKPVQPAAPDSYAGQRDLARFCMKSAAYEFARKGGPVAAVADAAVAQCAPKEADVIAALKRTGPVYPYQRQEIHEELTHLAKVSAVRARARGCGATGGAASRLLESKG